MHLKLVARSTVTSGAKQSKVVCLEVWKRSATLLGGRTTAALGLWRRESVARTRCAACSGMRVAEINPSCSVVITVGDAGNVNRVRAIVASEI